MKVRAIKTGYHGTLRVPGTPSATFDVPDDFPIGSWMEKVEEQPSLFSAHAQGRVVGRADGTSEPPVADDIDALRAQFSSLSGKTPNSGWTVEVLKKKISALEANT